MSTDFVHGVSGYRNHRCRCGVCTAGQAAEMRAYRRARTARGWERLSRGRFVPVLEEGLARQAGFGAHDGS